MRSAASFPLISVIMPAYNAAAFIGDSIDSVLQQTYTNWELITIDDGSVDNTRQVIQSYTAKDRRIQYYYQQNGRQGKARNLGLSKAKGELIAFLDADDLWMGNKLEIQVEQILQYNADLIFSDACIFESLPLNKINTMVSFKGLLYYTDGVKKMLEINRIPILTVLVKKQAVEAAGGFTEKPEIQNAEDYHLWLKLLMNKCKLYGTEDVLAAYRIHAAASTNNDKLAATQVAAAFYDLIQLYPRWKLLINSFLKKKLKGIHYSKNSWNTGVYRELIINTCKFSGHKWFTGLALMLYSMFGFKIIRKALAVAVLSK